MDIIIIGAGLAGLSAAYHLKKDYIILERNSRVGGLCRTETECGFSFDHSIHILYSSDSYASHLIREILLDGNYNIQPRESWVYSHGVYTEYPFQANLYGLPAEIIKECILGLVAAKYKSSQQCVPKNFEEWIYYTFGEGIARHFMIPYNRRVWAIEPKLMNYDWIAERLPIPELEDVLDGALKPPKKKYGPNREFWYPKQGGIESLPKGFLRYIQMLRLKADVTEINSRQKWVKVSTGERIPYQYIISTLPLIKLIQMLDRVSKDVEKACKGLQYNIIHTVNLGINRPKISPYHWVYFPEDDYIFHRISFPMNFASSMVLPGTSSVMAEISESAYKPVNRVTLIENTIRDLRKANILEANDEILFSRVITIEPAYIIYNLNHRENVNRILAFLESIGIYSCGRFGEWEYLNMDHSILSGKRAAEKIRAAKMEEPCLLRDVC